MTDIDAGCPGYATKALGAYVADTSHDSAHDSAHDTAQLTGRIDDLERQLKQMHVAQSRPALGGLNPVRDDYSHAFAERYLRKGLETGLEALGIKALNFANVADGGFAVPESLDRLVETKLRDISPLRAVAQVVQVGSADYKKLANTSGFGSGWVADNAARPETTTPGFAEVAVPTGELYANPAATQVMLDDAVFDVERWLADEIALEFAKQEGAAFITGSGTNRPRGITTYTTAATTDATRAFGTLQHIPTGVAGNFAASNPTDQLIDLVHALRPAYRQGAVFMMNSATLARVRKFKDLEGNYIWRPGIADGAPASILGYPVIEAEDMPDVAASSLSIAFGNFERGYVISERLGTRILRDPYSNKPFVHFYATRRVGGAVVNSEAIKFLRFSVS